MTGSNMTLTDIAGLANDTVFGFDAAAGDRIHLTTDTATNVLANSSPVDFGTATLLTLASGSTIKLVGVTHVDGGFFA